MGSRKAVLSVPRTLDMVPLGEILQGRSNQEFKAYSDNSDRYNLVSGLLKGVIPPLGKEEAWSSGEPTPAWSNNEFDQEVKYVQKSPVTSADECSLSNNPGIYVQGQVQSGLELTDSLESAPQGIPFGIESGPLTQAAHGWLSPFPPLGLLQECFQIAPIRFF